MEIGTGIAISGIGFSLVMLIYRVLPPKSTKVQTHADERASAMELRTMSGLRCPDHSGVIKGIENIEKTQEQHAGWLKEISNDIKKLIKAGNPHGD